MTGIGMNKIVPLKLDSSVLTSIQNTVLLWWNPPLPIPLFTMGVDGFSKYQ